MLHISKYIYFGKSRTNEGIIKMIRSPHSSPLSRHGHAKCLRRLFWNTVNLAPPDPILGLTVAYNEDRSPMKVNLGVGAYKDDQCNPFVLQSVRIAEEKLLGSHHEYAPIDGIPEFKEAAIKLLFGKQMDDYIGQINQIACIQTLSGTGALRLFAEFFARNNGDDKSKDIYIPDPTWGNHNSIFKYAGLNPIPYTYYCFDTKSLNFTGLISSLSRIPNNSLVLLHACAHNPTGCDPSPEEWSRISEIVKQRNHIVLFDCAYQGFCSGNPEKDAYAVRMFVRDGHPVSVCQSFAKNFGLYGERIGALHILTESKDEHNRIMSQLKVIARSMYSSPAIHGAKIVAHILSDPSLKSLWELECRLMADRIRLMRENLRENIYSMGSKLSWEHITSQNGMFCYTGLTKEQVLRLKKEFHIYLTDDGRISIAGLTSSNIAYAANAIHQVTK